LLAPSLRLEVKPPLATKQDCKETCFYNIMLLSKGMLTDRGSDTLWEGSQRSSGSGEGGLILETELVKDGEQLRSKTLWGRFPK